MLTKKSLKQNLSHQLLNHPITDYRVQNALNQLEQSYPYDDLAAYTRTQIYNTQELTDAALNAGIIIFFALLKLIYIISALYKD